MRRLDAHANRGDANTEAAGPRRGLTRGGARRRPNQRAADVRRHRKLLLRSGVRQARLASKAALELDQVADLTQPRVAVG